MSLLKMTTTDPIIIALEDQVACYAQLAKLAELQHEFVQNAQTDELLAVLAQRQHVLDQVTDLERILGPAKRRWSDFVKELSPADHATADELLAETRRLLERITTSDRNDALILQQRKMNLGKQISQTSAARQVNRTYATSAYGRPKSTMDLQQ